MTIKRITNTSLEANRVILRPQVTYTVSGSDITGSMPLIPNPSPRVKVVDENFRHVAPFQVLKPLSDIVENAIANMQSGGNAENDINEYLERISTSPLPSKNSKQFDMVIENVPGVNFLEASTNLPISGSRGALPSIVNSIIEKEIETNRNMEFGFTNYNCLGFVSGGYGTTRQALMYKDSSATLDFRTFGVSFFVKPPSVTTSEFRPATIFHIDNLITVSMVSGSTQDRFGNTDSFKIVSQLTSSNEIRVDAFKYDSISDIPANNTIYPNFKKHIVFTPDNVIKKNDWYHVAISISSNGSANEKEQKIHINGTAITGSLAEIKPEALFNRSFVNTHGKTNSQIIIGNKITGSSDYDQFFVEKYEDYEKYVATTSATEPSAYFESPFFGEVHEVVFATSLAGSFPIANFLGNRTQTLITSSVSSDLSIDFYLPVLFGAVKDQKFRTWPKKLEGLGLGKSTAPLQLTSAPHENWILSNDLRFPEVNITSFLGAYKFNAGSYTRSYPRCTGMESIDDLANDTNYYASLEAANSHEITSELSTFFTRNNLIRSCDNSSFVHDYNAYDSILDGIGGTNVQKSQRKDYLSSSFGHKDLSHVLMKNYVDYNKFQSRPSYLGNFSTAMESYSGDRLLSNTEPIFDKNIFKSRGASWYPLLNAETGYAGSNLVSVIDIPQMFYDKRIHPGTFEMIEHDLSGSLGRLTYNIKDNGLGALYRDDSAAPDTKNKCGLIFYELGIAVLTHPSLAMVGKNNFTINFKGERDLNVLNLNAHIGKYEFNESSNPSYNIIGKAGSKSDQNEIVMITGIEYLDENLNVVMKSSLSQPVSKREFDEILFRSRIDF
jgi:hypothetical protein